MSGLSPQIAPSIINRVLRGQNEELGTGSVSIEPYSTYNPITNTYYGCDIGGSISITFSAPSSGVISNSNDLSWTVNTSEPGNVVGFVILNLGGDPIFYYELPSPIIPVPNSGDTINIAIGGLTITLT